MVWGKYGGSCIRVDILECVVHAYEHEICPGWLICLVVMYVLNASAGMPEHFVLLFVFFGKNCLRSVWVCMHWLWAN